jgi:hypothetical protein
MVFWKWFSADNRSWSAELRNHLGSFWLLWADHQAHVSFSLANLWHTKSCTHNSILNQTYWHVECNSLCSFTVAGETGKCGNCSCPAGTCAKGNNESMTASGSDDTGKCGNCNCPPGTCANNKDWKEFRAGFYNNFISNNNNNRIRDWLQYQ